MTLKYERATFRIIIDSVVQIEVSIKGCDSDRDDVFPHQLVRAGKTMERIGRAIRKIQRELEAKAITPQRAKAEV